ncbi:MAG: hypothetical protein RBT65_15540 [Methanolobus sp.]|nr:hypothetical protein [Methanolobus sp.]
MSIKLFKDSDGQPKLGVAMSLCGYCGEPMGVALGGKDIDEVGSKGAVFSDEPCDTCKHNMEIGIMIVETQDKQDGVSNPYRTGRYIVITEDSFKRIFTINEKDKLSRFFYMEESLFERVFDEVMKEGETK